ncbi:MAG: HAD family phosphatase [Chitinophagaceae bacterium]|nr:HAD family phosphatase [Chitinophagaceae bacterium]
MEKTHAFIFDMNGTMIDDMPYHIRIWREIINGLGASLTLEDMKEQCYGKNGEVLERIFPGRFNDQEKDALEIEKEKYYQQVYRSEMKLIDGLGNFLYGAKKNNIAMGIGTAAIRFNVDFIVDGLDIRSYFNAIVTADDVSISKPHPETFLSCAAILGVDPAACIVFEDSPKGVETAANAGMQCVVLTTMHTKEEFSGFDNIISVIEDYTDKKLHQLFV